MLNAKQRAFAVEYIKDRNATQAAIRAGYSRKTAGSKGTSLLQIVGIQEALAELRKAAEARAGITVDKIVDRLNRIAEDPDAKASDRIKADELLGKYLGMFREKIDVTGQLDTNVTKLDGILNQLKD